MQKALAVQHDLLVSVTEKCNTERLERDDNLDVAVRSTDILLPRRPLDVAADHWLRYQCPRCGLVVSFPESVHFVHADPDNAIVVYAQFQAKFDIRIQ